jgi:DNA-directed RNA polymerase subunit E"
MKACKQCNFIIKNDNKCPACGSTELSEKFSGIAIIFDAEKSEVARYLGKKSPGEYALKIE